VTVTEERDERFEIHEEYVKNQTSSTMAPEQCSAGNHQRIVNHQIPMSEVCLIVEKFEFIWRLVIGIDTTAIRSVMI
jgi:hypothetical protein